MADEAVNEAESKETAAKVNNNTIKLIIAGVVMIILAAGISFGVATYAMKKAAPVEKGDGYGKVKTEKLEATFDAGEFITNIKDRNSSNRFLKLRIVLELPDKTVEEEIKNKLPQVQSVIITELRSQSVEELMADNATVKLSEQLKKKINELLLTGNINNVYFTSFLVQ